MAQLTDLEKELVKNTFKGNEALLVAIRKIFFPALDLNAKIGEQIDFWLNEKFEGLSDAEIARNMKARALFIGHVEGALLKLKQIAEAEEKTPEQLKEEAKKNSSK